MPIQKLELTPLVPSYSCLKFPKDMLCVFPNVDPVYGIDFKF